MRAFNIPLAGLKIGTHVYEFDIDQTFFEGLEYNTLIESGTAHVVLSLQKKETMMIGEFTIDGLVDTFCDRCNDPLQLPVSGSYRVVYKFSTELSDDESLVILDPDAYELNVAPQIYEFMCVSLPPRKLHPRGECNEEMMQLFSTYTVNANQPDEEEDDEDWEDEDWEDEDYPDNDPEEDDLEEDGDDPDDEPDNDKPIDPRWSALKNLN